MSDNATRMEDRETSGALSGVTRTPDSLLGATIDGRYRVDGLLGEGGMGLVYEAVHTRLQKPLAIKVLRRENIKDPEVLERFQREAESASGIGNQHIVDISDFGTLQDGSTYFVMERLHGADLIDAIDMVGRMPEERAIHIAMQICRALGAAHGAGIVHRDLKPENVFLIERDGVEDFVKVLDFGIAKVAHGPNRLTRAGEVLGTPHYMSPEQCEGEGIDHRTDVYALGVLLYEMLTGHVPHDADTMMGILTKHLYEEPITPKERLPEVSAEVDAIIMRCLEKKPERRYQTMQDIYADLERLRAGEPTLGPRSVTLAVEKPARRRVAPVYLAGVAVVVLILIGALTFGGQSSDDAALSSAAGTADDVSTAPAKPAPEAPPPSPPTAENEEPSPLLSPAQEAVGEPAPTPARAKRARRKPRPRPKPAAPRDPAILDPWN